MTKKLHLTKVYEDEIDLGSRDMMKNYLDEVVKKTTLIKAASSNVVDKYLSQHYTSQGVNKILSPLMKNVPYRFLSPWIKYTTDEEVIEKSNAKNYSGIYSLHSDHIVIDEEWWKYLKEHYYMRMEQAAKKKEEKEQKKQFMAIMHWKLGLGDLNKLFCKKKQF